MKLKTILLVVAILAALSGISFVLNRKKPPADEADARVHQPLIDADTVNKAAAVRITDGGKTVLLKKDGSTWRVASYYDLPADFQKLARFVQDFSDARIDRFVTSSPARLKALEFKDTQVSLLDASEHPLVAITLGKSAEGGGRFLRFGDETKAYLAPVDAWIDTESRNWADSALTHFKADDVERIALAFPGAPAVTLTRPKKGGAFAAAATPAGQRLKEATVDSLLSSLGGLRFTDTTALDDPKAKAARDHFRTVTFTTFDGETITVSLGREPEKTVPVEPAAKEKTGGPEAVVGPIADKEKDKAAAKTAGPAKVVGPVTKTIPAGPVFAAVSTTDSTDAVNAIMKKRAFEVGEFVFTGLPAKPGDLFEPLPEAKPKAEPAATSATSAKPAAASTQPAKVSKATPARPAVKTVEKTVGKS